MSTDRTSQRATLRALVVVGLAALVLGYSLPDLRRVWQPLGDLKYATDLNGFVNTIEPRSAAEMAGLRVGDFIDIAATPPRYRVDASLADTLYPGQPVSVAVVRNKQPYLFTIVSEAEATSPLTKALIMGRAFSLLLFVGIGATLVLLRPSLATWGFYFYCLGLNGAANILALFLLPIPWNLMLAIIVVCFITAIGFVGVAVFAVSFLHETLTGWRKASITYAPVALLVLCSLAAYNVLAGSWFGWPTRISNDAILALEAALTLVAIVAFAETYFKARGSDQQRIRWVITGFGIALVARMINDLLQAGFVPPYWLHSVLLLVGVVVPITVAYAVIKHRIIDVSFVVSRALVYGILTTLLVGVFSLIDWFFTDYLRNARLGTVAEVGAVLAFGMWFNGLHKRVDELIDATFFRQRHRAELQLARIAAALPLAMTTSDVAHFLVDEPVRTMSLASSALFRRGLNGLFTREGSEGWALGTVTRLDEDDGPLLILAQAENGPLSLYDHPWRTESVPLGPARPVLALPILVRRELAAIVLYGSHEHGEALDPDEIKAIAGLATGAAAAYDHLEAEAMRQQVASLQETVKIQQALLAEAQIQPT